VNGRLVLLLLAGGAAAAAGLLYSRRAAAAGQTDQVDGAGVDGGGGGTLPPAAVSPSISWPDFNFDFSGAISGLTDQLVSAGTWSPPAKAGPYLDDIAQAESDNGIPTNLLAREIQKESNWNPNAVNKRTGAQGLCQILPDTAADPGYGVDPCDPTDPSDSIRFMGQYLGAMYRRTGTWSKALAAYNWGLGNVQKNPDQASWPAETRDYVATITTDVGVA